MRSQHLKIHGTTLASLLHSVVAGERYCDGLLFGDVQEIETQQLCDDDEAITMKETTLHIQDFLTNTASCSFYDSSGALQDRRLEELCKGASAPLLGWLVYRPCTHASPSMREACVSLALKQRLAAQQGRQAGDAPLVLLVVSSTQEHLGATLSLSYRAFLVHCDSSTGSSSSGSSRQVPSFEALELQTLNMGRSLGFNAYQQYSPLLMPQLVASAGAAGAAAAGGRQQGSSSSSTTPIAAQLRELAVGGSLQQVQSLERLYEVLLRQMSEAARHVSDSQAEVAAEAAKNSRLLAAAAAAAGPLLDT